MMDAPGIPDMDLAATAPPDLCPSVASSSSAPVTQEAPQADGDSEMAEMAEAIKQIFDEHCWTIDQSFRWFDFNKRSRISRFAWETGARMLNLGKRLNIKPLRPFTIMSKGNEISLKDWRAFFGEQTPEDEGAEEEDDGLGSDSGTKGAKKVPHGLRRARSELSKLTESSGRRKSKDDADLPCSAGRLSLNSISEDDELRLMPTSPTALPNLASLMQLGDEEDDDHEGSSTPSGRFRKAAKNLRETDAHIAEAEQLAEEIQELELKGLKALAYIFTAKCGSLDGAFRWLDCNSKGAFANVQWQTAITVMHIDIQALTGVRPRDIFLKMGGKSGRVTKKSWDRFFANEVDDWLRSKMSGLQEAFEARSRKRLRKMWKESLSPSAAQGGEKDGSTSSNRRDRGAGAEPTARASSRRPSIAGKGGGESGSEAVAGAAGAGRGSRSHGQSREAASSSHAADDDRKGGSATRLSVAKGQGGSRNRSSSSRCSVVGPGGADTSGPDANSAVGSESRQSLQKSSPEVPDTDRFKMRMMEELSSLAPDEGREYKNLTRAERVALREVAAIFDIWLGNDGQATLLYRIGPVGEGIVTRLEEVNPGERLEIPGLPAVRCAFASAKAEGLSLWGAAVDGKGGLKTLTVFNLGGNIEEFLAGITRTLKELAPGQVVDFPWSLLDESRQEVIRSTVADLGMMSHEFGDQLSVGNLSSFAAHVRHVLEELDSSSLHTFVADERCPERVPGEGLPALARRIVRTLAEAAGDSASESEDENGAKVVNVLGGGGLRSPMAFPVAKPLELDEEGIKENVRRLFGVYATGTQGRNTFLRKPDLYRLTDDAAAQRNQKVEKDAMEDIETVYDETLELQVDMGSRVHRGITVDYFQVFLTKVSTLLGWSLSSLLMALLEWYSR